jgi:hypothetical protein
MRPFTRVIAQHRAHPGNRRGVQWAVGTTLVLLMALAAAPVAHDASAGGDVEPAITEEPLTQYRALRRMHARSEKFGHEGWLDAWTELNGRTFTYQVVSERGSEYVRNKVLREMLKREQQMVASGQASRGDLTATNYEFSETDESRAGEHHVLLTPKRKDVMLVHGRMVLTSDGRDLLRVEGRLAKNPSFWTSLVNVIRRYARLGGVRVPVSVETTAKVKLAGTSHLRVDYEYESINGRPVPAGAFAVNRRSSNPMPASGR